MNSLLELKRTIIHLVDKIRQSPDGKGNLSIENHIRLDKIDEAIRNFAAKPICFGSNPGAQARAENDCQNCSHELHCLPRIDKVHTFESTKTGAKIEVSFDPESDVGRAQAARSAFNKQEGGDHYKNMKSQPFGFVRDNNVGHAEGEAIYRLLRWRDKGGIADLKKVIHTVELIIEYEEGRKP